MAVEQDELRVPGSPGSDVAAPLEYEQDTATIWTRRTISRADLIIERARARAGRLVDRAPVLDPILRRSQHRRRKHIIQHAVARRHLPISSLIVPDKAITSEDVTIAARLLAAFRATQNGFSGTRDRRIDVWSEIYDRQSRFTAVLKRDDPQELAEYLSNVSRRDAAIGIIQGDSEFQRIARSRSYREFLTLMTWDKLVSLAEALGTLPVENPEQGMFGTSLYLDPIALVESINHTMKVDIAPPDVDGGLFKIDTQRGLFGERDLNAIFTANLLARVSRTYRVSHICEIGGGSGRVAYWSHRLGVGSYTIIDLPLVNVVQGYYLLKSLPWDRVVLYGEDQRQDGCLRLLPNSAILDDPRAPYDLILNQDSMPEMNAETVKDYLQWLKASSGRYFVSINHESKPPYGRKRRHVNIHETISEIGGLKLELRFPYWLRKGYVVEVYEC